MKGVLNIDIQNHVPTVPNSFSSNFRISNVFGSPMDTKVSIDLCVSSFPDKSRLIKFTGRFSKMTWAPPSVSAVSRKLISFSVPRLEFSDSTKALAPSTPKVLSLKSKTWSCEQLAQLSAMARDPGLPALVALNLRDGCVIGG